MTGDGTNDAPALAQADVGVAMNTGTAAAKEAGNMVDLDSSPTKLIDIVEIGKQLLITRGALTTFSLANDVAKYFAILPAMFMVAYPGLAALNIMQLSSPTSAILSAVIFNALIIVALIPLAMRGVRYRPSSAAKLLNRNLLIYGVGGLIVPFIGIKLIDLVISLIPGIGDHHAHHRTRHSPSTDRDTSPARTVRRRHCLDRRAATAGRPPVPDRHDNRARDRLSGRRSRSRATTRAAHRQRFAGHRPARHRGRLEPDRSGIRRRPAWFVGRPSAAGDGYDAMASGGSNLAADSPELQPLVEQRRAEIAAANGVDPSAVPADAVTASGSGLDPDISPAYALHPGARGSAGCRGLSDDLVHDLVATLDSSGRSWGSSVMERVNVLELNLALEQPAGAVRCRGLIRHGNVPEQVAACRRGPGAGPAAGLPRRGTGRRQDRGDAVRGPTPGRPGHERGGRRRGEPRPGVHGRTGRRPAGGARRGDGRIAASSCPRWTFGRCWIAARRRAGRRARAHQRARSAARSAGRTSISCSPPGST